MQREIPMSLRLAIAQMDVSEVNVAEFCRDHQISRVDLTEEELAASFSTERAFANTRVVFERLEELEL